MRRILSAVLICPALLLIPLAAAQDLEKGKAAAQRGDFESALREWRPLAESGLPQAQFLLGLAYDRGKGVEKDRGEAARWYRLSAEQGYALAQYNLAVLYYDGDGVPQDYRAAAKWYRRAAEGGHARAQYNLGFLYANGIGVPENFVQAYMWFTLATEEDIGRAWHTRDLIAKEMSAGQMAEAMGLVERWRNAHR